MLGGALVYWLEPAPAVLQVPPEKASVTEGSTSRSLQRVLEREAQARAEQARRDAEEAAERARRSRLEIDGAAVAEARNQRTGDPSATDDLKRAGVDTAHSAMVITDESDGQPHTDSTYDARAVLTVLAITGGNVHKCFLGVILHFFCSPFEFSFPTEYQQSARSVYPSRDRIA